MGGLFLLYLTYANLKLARENTIHNQQLLQLVKDQYSQDSARNVLDINSKLPVWIPTILDSGVIHFSPLDSSYVLNFMKAKIIKDSTLAIFTTSVKKKANLVGFGSLKEKIPELLNKTQNKALDEGDSVLFPIYSGILFDYSYKQKRWNDYALVYLKFKVRHDSVNSPFELTEFEFSDYYGQAMYGMKSQKIFEEEYTQKIYNLLFAPYLRSN